MNEAPLASMKRIRLAVIGIVVLIAMGSAVFSQVEGRSFYNSAYFIVVTLTTVGYGDIVPATAEGKLAAMVTSIAGWILLGLLVASLTELLVEGQVRRLLGRKKLEKEIAALSNHYIVCGFGRIGAIVCREFHQAGVPFVVIEHSRPAVEKADEEGYPRLRGDATDDDCLTAAGILRARGLVSVLASDADNVYVTMSARDLNRKLLIVSRGEDERTARKLSRAGANKVISPYEIGGLRLAHAILRPSVIDFIEVATRAGTEIDMEEIRVRESSVFVGKSLKDSGIRQAYGLIIVAIRKPDGRMTFNPSHLTEIERDDVLITMGPESSQQRLVADCRRGTD